MKYIKQLFIILFISFLGEVLSALIPVPIPASIYGIVLLFLALEFRIIKLSAVEETGRFLIEIMPMLFIPAAVGLIDTWDVLKTGLLPYLVITFLTTFVVMIVVGRVTQRVIRIKSKPDVTGTTTTNLNTASENFDAENAADLYSERNTHK